MMTLVAEVSLTEIITRATHRESKTRVTPGSEVSAPATRFRQRDQRLQRVEVVEFELALLA